MVSYPDCATVIHVTLHIYNHVMFMFTLLDTVLDTVLHIYPHNYMFSVLAVKAQGRFATPAAHFAIDFAACLCHFYLQKPLELLSTRRKPNTA